jgi:hypothetical protein
LNASATTTSILNLSNQNPVNIATNASQTLTVTADFGNIGLAGATVTAKQMYVTAY